MVNRTVLTIDMVPSLVRITAILLLLWLARVSLGQEMAPLSQRDAVLPMQQVVPTRSSAPLINPGMGLYLYGTLDANDLPADVWFSPLIQIGYFREDWSVLEPDAEGKYRFDEYFGPIFDLWVKRWQRRVAFRFMSENMHSRRKYVTPKWVFDQGVPSVTLKGLYTKEQVDPVFWDDRYLAIQERFITDLGKYLDGRPGLEFIDIGSIGEWGEMHLARWTPEMLEQTGFTPTRYIAAYRKMIDAFARAFPKTRVFLNVGDYEAINDYAAIKGLHFRQDGLTPSGPSADVGKRFYRSYSRRGVVCNYELHSGYEEMTNKGWGVQETFAKGLEDPISYLHINLMSYRQLAKAPEDVTQAVTDAASRVGFRFVLTKLRCNKTLRLSGETPARLLLEHTWKNEGVAPCYSQITLKQPVLPASRYRLSCWMHLENIDAGAPAPYLKIGLSDAKGKWLTNIQTNSYDVARPGTWQRLVALVETTPITAGGHLAIEKGNLEGRIAATIRLDDVRLELLESP